LGVRDGCGRLVIVNAEVVAKPCRNSLLLLPGAELPLMVESFGPLNDLFPFPSILDEGYPVFNLHLANILFDVILPSVLGFSL